MFITFQYGLTDIFSTNADLSGISSSEPLVLGDLVQLVTVYVEEGSSETNYLTGIQIAYIWQYLYLLLSGIVYSYLQNGRTLNKLLEINRRDTS